MPTATWDIERMLNKNLSNEQSYNKWLLHFSPHKGEVGRVSLDLQSYSTASWGKRTQSEQSMFNFYFILFIYLFIF